MQEVSELQDNFTTFQPTPIENEIVQEGESEQGGDEFWGSFYDKFVT